MSTPPAPPLTLVQPGEGRAGEVIPGFGVVFKLWSADTGGAVSIVEHPFEPGVLVPRAGVDPRWPPSSRQSTPGQTGC